MFSVEVQYSWMGSWKNHWNVVGVIDIVTEQTKPFNVKFTVAGTQNYIWFQNNYCLCLCGNLTVLEWGFVYLILFGIHVEFLNVHQQKWEKKTLSDKVVLNVARKIWFKWSSVQKSIIGETRHHETSESSLLYLQLLQRLAAVLVRFNQTFRLTGPK